MLNPWPHQRTALTDLLRGHAALWWEPGAGKTLPLALAGAEAGGRQLWVTLGMLRGQAARDIEQARGRCSIQIIRSQSDTIAPGADVVIVSYDLIRSAPIWRQAFGLRWSSMVCDEAHALKEGRSLRTRALYGATRESQGALWRKADRVWIATGTPMVNHPGDLYTHISRLWPVLLPGAGRKQDWVDTYCVTRRTQFGLQIVGGRNLPELNGLLKRCGTVVRLEDVAPDLPAMTVDEVPVEIDAAHRADLAAAMNEQQQRELVGLLAAIDGGSAKAEAALQGLLLPLATARRVLALAKAKPTAARISAEIEGGLDRVVVFGQHVEALGVAAAELQKHGVGLLLGSTPPEKRQALIDGFVAGRLKALVANVTVAGTGLNLQACRRIVFVDSTWTPAANTQAIRRCHRAGQRRPVHVSFVSVAGSVDEQVQRTLARKAALVDALMGGAE